MSNYNSLKATIDANIKQNGNQEITGQILNSVLNQMVTTLGAGYQFAGVATLDPATDPGTPDAKVFYIANGKGTYTNFGGIEVTEDDVVVLYWDSAWHKVSTGIASKEKLTELERDLGQYAELPSVTMTAETTGKYINADGEFVDDADFNIAAIGAVVVGNTYELYMRSAANMKLGVALFVARIKTTTTSGTERIEYVPLFSAMSTDIPTSGYVCFEAMDAYSDVLVCYRADVPEAATLLVRRYGTKASIATQINNLRKKVDLKSFADGYYESMRVGTADNLTSKGDATEEVIMSRKAGGDNQIEDGSASIKRIKGYSVVMNQQFSQNNVLDSGITIEVLGDRIIKATPIGEPSSPGSISYSSGWIQSLRKATIGHIYYYRLIYTRIAKRTDVEDFNPERVVFLLTSNYYDATIGEATIICDIGRASTNILGVTLNDCIVSVEDMQVIDLTQMFGIGNEPSTPEDFAKRLGYSSINDVPYIPYNEGEIVSSFAEGIKTTDTEGKVSERKWSETLKKYFPDGLKSAGSAFDEITPTKAVKRIKALVLDETANIDSVELSGDYLKFMILGELTIEERQGLASAPFYYQYNGGFYYDVWAIGFASRSSLIGCVPKSVASNITELRAFLKKLKDEGNPLTILYQLVSDKCEEYTYDELNLTEQVSEGGTEEAIIVDGKTSTPLRADIVYPIDAYNTIKANKANIGTLSSLNTASKTDLVSAINELAGKVAALEANATEVTNETTE